MGFILGAKYENQYNIQINMIKGKKTHMIMSIDTEKPYDKSYTHDKKNLPTN